MVYQNPRQEQLFKPCLICGRAARVICHSRFERTKYCSKACRLIAINRLSVARRKGKPGKPWGEQQRLLMRAVSDRRSAQAVANPIRRLSRGYVQTRTGPGQEVREHRVIVERVLGRPLRSDEIVHHVNLNKHDNRNRNLIVCTKWLHQHMHWEMQRLWAKEHFDGSMD